MGRAKRFHQILEAWLEGRKGWPRWFPIIPYETVFIVVALLYYFGPGDRQLSGAMWFGIWAIVSFVKRSGAWFLRKHGWQGWEQP